jgi:hypothetical protein
MFRAVALAAAAAVAASLAAGAGAEDPPFNPVGAQKALLIPIATQIPAGTSWYPDCTPKKPGDKGYADDINWVKDWVAGYTAPRRTAKDWQAALDSGTVPLSADYLATSYGETSWSFKVLVNPGRPDGWWPSPHNLDEYCKNAVKLWLTDSNLGNWTGDAAIGQDAIETILPEAIKAGAISAADAASYHRAIVMDTYARHAGQAMPRWTYKVDYGAGPVAVDWSASVVSQGADDADFADQTEHEVGHQLGLWDYYGSCPDFLPSSNLDCTGMWDPMSNDTYRPHFNSYSAWKARVDRQLRSR